MKHTFSIEGMTCQNCQRTIENAINLIEGVQTVDINLEKGEAQIDMSYAIPVDVLQKALPDKYKIIKQTNTPLISNNLGPEEPSKLQQLKPLLLILLYITVASILLHYKEWSWNDFMLDFMGLFFIVFSFFKILDLKNFPASFRMYDPLAMRLPLYAKVYPFIETILGLMFLMRIEIRTALVVTLIILSITTFGVTKTLLDKRSIRCACLGTALNLPMTEATFIENVLMIAMALVMLF